MGKQRKKGSYKLNILRNRFGMSESSVIDHIKPCIGCINIVRHLYSVH